MQSSAQKTLESADRDRVMELCSGITFCKEHESKVLAAKNRAMGFFNCNVCAEVNVVDNTFTGVIRHVRGPRHCGKYDNKNNTSVGADEVEAIKAAGDNRTKRTTQHKQQVAKKARQEQVDALAAGLTSPPPPAAQPAVTPATVPASGMAQAIADAAL